MKIWINTPFDTLPGERGRPMRYWQLARALVAAGHEVVVWSSDFHHVTKRRREVAACYECEGIEIRLVATRPYRRNIGPGRLVSHWSYARRWRRAAVAAVAAGEVALPERLVVSMPPLELYGAAAALRRRWGVPVVVDIQDLWPENFYRLWRRGWGWLGRLVLWPWWWCAGRAYRGADGVAAVAERYLELARRRGARGRMGWFPLAVGLQSGGITACRDGKEAVGGALGEHALPGCGGKSLPPSRGDAGCGGITACRDGTEGAAGVKLCYVGNLGAGYDLGTVVEGVRRLAAAGRRVRVVVAGDGPERGLVERAAAEGVPINYHGFVGAEEMWQLLAQCDVGLVPMFSESGVVVPNKVIDYGAAGLAIISGLKGECEELLARYGAGAGYKAGCCDSFVAAVERYLNKPELIEEHGAGARRMVAELFDGGVVYKRMAEWLVQREADYRNQGSGCDDVDKRRVKAAAATARRPPGDEAR